MPFLYVNISIINFWGNMLITMICTSNGAPLLISQFLCVGNNSGLISVWSPLNLGL